VGSRRTSYILLAEFQKDGDLEMSSKRVGKPRKIVSENGTLLDDKGLIIGHVPTINIQRVIGLFTCLPSKYTDIKTTKSRWMSGARNIRVATYSLEESNQLTQLNYSGAYKLEPKCKVGVAAPLCPSSSGQPRLRSGKLTKEKWGLSEGGIKKDDREGLEWRKPLPMEWTPWRGRRICSANPKWR
jgi:hypothetical protein